MLNFLKPGRPGPSSDAEALVEELARQSGPLHPFNLKNYTAGVKIQNAAPELQCAVVIAMLHWLEAHERDNQWDRKWKVHQALHHLLKRKLPFTEQDAFFFVDWSSAQSSNYFRSAPQVIKVVGDYLKENELTPRLHKSVDKLIRILESQRMSVDARRWVLRLRELTGDTRVDIPLEAGDVWADTALAEIQELDVKTQTTWAELLLYCLRASGSAPSSKWMKSADAHISMIGVADFFDALIRWFPLVDKPRAGTVNDRVTSLNAVNADILKGLAWISAKSDHPAMASTLTALAISAYRKIPGVGPRASKIGNACFWALGNMPGPDGVAQLSLLKLKIKTNTAQKVIQSALEIAAKRAGISAAEIEEMSVPTYGLEEVGLRLDDFGEVRCELRVNGSDVEQAWIRRDGKILSAAPKAIKQDHADPLKEISQAVKDIRRMLPAQRDRIDNLYLEQKKWSFEAWRARYLDHPLVGTIARRLIWKFSKADQAASGIWFDGRIVARDGSEITWLDDATTVELWHPIDADSNVVLEWRQWMLEHEIRQPFKQAYREIYLLTDAERNTRVYSNRYAAHILRQHQFNSLCAARGWKNALRLLVDADFPPARKELPKWGLRAEYWIEGAGDEYGVDTNETGTFLYLTTDQVRFYRRDSAENRAHAGGGGYAAARWNQNAVAEPLPVEEIPALVFSEIMRDVDMFVGVASVGNDPNWLDGGPEVRYRDYWHGFSFGELTESSKTRRQVLETLVPRLKIAPRCSLVDKFLVVRGDIRTYKIHLGSGNILMEPNDQYLCIVPARGGDRGQERLFVPFEGDQTLAIILSKAFLLAEDKKITDPTITRQLKR